MYVCASDTCILYTVIVHVNKCFLSHSFEERQHQVRELHTWPYYEHQSAPMFLKKADCESVESKLKFWKVVEKYVQKSGASMPLKFLNMDAKVSTRAQSEE